MANGQAVNLAYNSSDNNLYVSNAENLIYNSTNYGEWYTRVHKGKASNMSIGVDGVMWVIATSNNTQGNEIYQYGQIYNSGTTYGWK